MRSPDRSHARDATPALVALALLGSHACASSPPSGSDPFAIVDDAGGARPLPLADAGVSDAALEASDENAPGPSAPPLAAFVDAVSDAFCARLGECCYAAEYGGWKQASCVAWVDGLGGFKLLGVHRAATQGAATRVAYDPDRALDCLYRVQSMSCTIARAELETVRDTCFAALEGRVPPLTPSLHRLDRVRGGPMRYADGRRHVCAARCGGPALHVERRLHLSRHVRAAHVLRRRPDAKPDALVRAAARHGRTLRRRHRLRWGVRDWHLLERGQMRRDLLSGRTCDVRHLPHDGRRRIVG
jgi:hypothetical protein